MSQEPNKSNPFKKIFLVALVLDLLWATLIATFGATILGQVGTIGGAAEGATQTVTVLGWLITFIIAFFQGAIFMVVLGGFAVVLLLLFGGKKRS
ncbi:MAG: hypothetical protein R3F51_12750 [Cyanobacteriota/Melainabacteria group bacterium]